MKISEMIKKIQNLATSKFGVSSHNNDNITICMFFTADELWQVWLSRPTKNALKTYETFNCSNDEYYVTEELTYFNTYQRTLPDALKKLYSMVEYANPDDFSSEVTDL